MLTKLYSKEEKQDKLKENICKLASDNLAKNRPIWKADIIQKSIEEEHDDKISTSNICKILHKELGLGYRKIRKVAIQANSERCLILR